MDPWLDPISVDIYFGQVSLGGNTERVSGYQKKQEEEEGNVVSCSLVYLVKIIHKTGCALTIQSFFR